MKWIKCKDKLPKKLKRYLVFNSDQKMYNVADWNSQKWYNSILENKVTHWAELPEMPQSGTKCHDLDETDIDALPK